MTRWGYDAVTAMSGDGCQDLDLEFEIRMPADLRKAIRIVPQHLRGGTLEEVEGNVLSTVPFLSISESGVIILDDSAETYRVRKVFGPFTSR